MVAKNSGKPWVKKDILTIKKMAGTRPTGIIAYDLGRTKSAIFVKASQENISLKPINKSPYNRHKNNSKNYFGDIIGSIDMNNLLKAMEGMWKPQEETFAFTEALFTLEKTCPQHGVGQKDLSLLRYTYLVCKRILKKKESV